MNKTTRGILLGVLGALCWGFSGVCVNYVVAHYDLSPWWIGFMRLAGVSPFFLVAAIGFDRKNLIAMLRDRRAILALVVFAVVGMAIYQATYAYTIEIAGAAAESVISQTGLLYVMIFECIQERRMPRKHAIACLALAFAGVFCIATKGDVTRLALGFAPLMWCLLEGVMLFLHNVIPLYPLRKYGSLPVNTAAMCAGAAVLLPLAHPWDCAVSLGPDGWVALVLTALVGAGLGYVFSMQAIRDAGAFNGSLVIVVEPISSMVLSALLLGVSFTSIEMLGCGLIAVMIVVLAYCERNDSGKQPQEQRENRPEA